jgi:hypothetical protein
MVCHDPAYPDGLPKLKEETQLCPEYAALHCAALGPFGPLLPHTVSVTAADVLYRGSGEGQPAPANKLAASMEEKTYPLAN